MHDEIAAVIGRPHPFPARPEIPELLEQALRADARSPFDH